MKIKQVILALFTCIFFNSCSSDGVNFNFPNPLDSGGYGVDFFGSVLISDNCDCLQSTNPWTCSSHNCLTENEYKRILEIVNQQTEPCFYIEGVNCWGQTFEGYFIQLNMGY